MPGCDEPGPKGRKIFSPLSTSSSSSPSSQLLLQRPLRPYPLHLSSLSLHSFYPSSNEQRTKPKARHKGEKLPKFSIPSHRFNIIYGRCSLKPSKLLRVHQCPHSGDRRRRHREVEPYHLRRHRVLPRECTLIMPPTHLPADYYSDCVPLPIIAPPPSLSCSFSFSSYLSSSVSTSSSF